MDKFSINWRRVGVFAGLALLVLMVIEFNARLEDFNVLNEQAKAFRVQATQAMQTQVALQTQAAYAGSDAAAEEYARKEGHMVKDGEIPVVPIGEANSLPIATPTPAPTPTPLPNWQVWWNLFFGEK